jgi:predicted DCC family thiol-disulfide oxidoreductase YuxK
MTNAQSPMTNNVILFDGICNFCNASVNFVLDRDRNKKFMFAPLQSEIGKQLQEQFNIQSGEKMQSVILISDNKVYRKSSATLEIAKGLGGVWYLFYIFKIFPAFIRDIFYDLIAVNRYRIFGKRETCRIPDPEIKSRFLG